MLTYLLEKLDKIKKNRALYCSQIEETRIEETRIEKTRIEKTRIEEEKTRLLYDLICK
jgi:hypothetical protein